MTEHRPENDSPLAHQLGNSVETYLARQGLRQMNTLAVVAEHWVDIVGAALSEHAKPTNVRDGQLVISVDQPAWATEVKFHINHVVQTLEKYLGPGVITGVTVHVRP